MYPEVGDTVGNAFDDDLGTVLAVYRDDAKVKWEDGSITYETFFTFGDKDCWFRVEV